MESVITIRNLDISLHSRDGNVHAACDVNLQIRKGEVWGLIGETGCGKSVLGQSILRLLPVNAEVKGSISFYGREILTMTKKELRDIRGKKMAYICQNPNEALNPVLKNGTQVMEAVKMNRPDNSSKKNREISISLLKSLHFSNPMACMEYYPFQLSGGMKQRVLAAMGMSGTPEILIADEPTKGLDALTRGQVIYTVKKFLVETSCAALVITHDLKFAEQVCTHIAVMYAGEIVEYGSVSEVFSEPKHPYMRALIQAQPHMGMHMLKGSACSLLHLPDNCRFYARCSEGSEACTKQHMPLEFHENEHRGRCVKCLEQNT